MVLSVESSGRILSEAEAFSMQSQRASREFDRGKYIEVAQLLSFCDQELWCGDQARWVVNTSEMSRGRYRPGVTPVMRLKCRVKWL